MIERVYVIQTRSGPRYVTAQELAEILSIEPETAAEILTAYEVKEERHGGKQNLL